MQGNLSVERMCELAKVSRAGFYRTLQEQRPSQVIHGLDAHATSCKSVLAISRSSSDEVAVARISSY